MKIKISVDSCADLSKELVEKYDIGIMPLRILLGEKDHADGIDITPKDIYEYVGKTGNLPKTAAATEESFFELFEGYLKNYDKVIHFNISGEMSVTHTNACHAAERLDGKVVVIDSRSLSTGIGAQAIYAAKLCETETDFDKIVENIKQTVNKVQASFILDKLNYLHKGGRCSSVALLGANLLKIKPCIEVNDGKMGMARKYMGAFAKNVEKYVLDTLEKYNNYEDDFCFVTHTEIDPQVVENVKQILKEKSSFKEIFETEAGSTITSHCGSNTIGILYIKK